jgi:hypothetical protein
MVVDMVNATAAYLSSVGRNSSPHHYIVSILALFVLYSAVFAILENVEGGIFMPAELRLDASEWEVITMGEAVLKPLMFAQRVLEGELYVTNSLVAPIIFEIRAHLQNTLREQQLKQAANTADIVQCMVAVIAAFEDRYSL